MAPVTYAMHLVDNQEARAVGQVRKKALAESVVREAHLRNEQEVDLVSCESFANVFPIVGVRAVDHFSAQPHLRAASTWLSFSAICGDKRRVGPSPRSRNMRVAMK